MEIEISYKDLMGNKYKQGVTLGILIGFKNETGIDDHWVHDHWVHNPPRVKVIPKKAIYINE